MISVQSIVDKMKSVLDAEGSDRYLFDQDFKPAINHSKDWLVAVFNKAFADRKLSEEDLRELINVRVYQANQFSRVDVNKSGDSIWTILKVNPEPEVYPNNTLIAIPDAGESIYREDLTYIRSKFSAKRLTLEQWEENVDNVFEAGNERLSNSFKSYAYLNAANYNSSNYNSGSEEIEVRPSVPGQLVAVGYLKYPDNVSLETDSLPFPENLTELIVQKALNLVSFKQGDQTNLYSVTAKDVSSLIQLMS